MTTFIQDPNIAADIQYRVGMIKKQRDVLRFLENEVLDIIMPHLDTMSVEDLKKLRELTKGSVDANVLVCIKLVQKTSAGELVDDLRWET